MIHRHTVMRMLDGKLTPKRVYDPVFQFSYQGDVYEIGRHLVDGFFYIHQKNGKAVKKEPAIDSPFWDIVEDWWNKEHAK